MKQPTHNTSASLKEGLLWGVAGRLLLVFGNLLTLAITSRILDATQFGVFAAAMIFVDVAWAIANATMSVALIQRKELTPEHELAAFWASAAIATMYSAALFLANEVLASAFQAPTLGTVLIAIAAITPLRLLAGFYGALLQRRLDLRYYQMTQSLPQILGLCGVTTVAALLGAGVWALVLGFGVTALLELILSAHRAKFSVRWAFTPAALAELYQISAASGIARLANFVATNVDKLVIGITLGPSALGVYSRAFNLMMTPVKTFGIAASRTFLPVFSRMQDDPNALARTIRSVLAVQGVLLLPLGVGCALAAPLIVRVVLGPSWEAAIAPAQLLFCALFARLGYIATEAAALAIGDAWRVALRQALLAAGTSVLVIVASAFGILAVSAAVGVSLILYYLSSFAQIAGTHHLSFSDFVAAHARGLTLVLLCGLAASLGYISPLPQIANLPALVAYFTSLILLLAFAPRAILGESLIAARATSLRYLAKRFRRDKEQ